MHPPILDVQPEDDTNDVPWLPEALFALCVVGLAIAIMFIGLAS